MTFYVTNQNFVVLCIFILGGALGVIYDLFTLKRMFLPTHQVLLVIEDLLFCAISFVLFLAVIFVTNYGYVRWYEIVSALLGFFLYRLLLCRLFIKVMSFFIRLLIKALVILFTPLRLALIFIIKGSKSLLNKIYDLYVEHKIIKLSKKRMRRDSELSKKGFGI